MLCFILGVFIGAFLGMIVVSLLHVAREPGHETHYGTRVLGDIGRGTIVLMIPEKKRQRPH
jgi:hypothetical protein